MYACRKRLYTLVRVRVRWIVQTQTYPACTEAGKAQHKTVTHPCGDHAQSRLATAFESGCSHRVPLTHPIEHPAALCVVKEPACLL